ncbi:hypothetical protein VNO78_32001 [Psophocarpus tetragonolobus]|uniref:Uncharacterized protein n=1 Tax=Psophocarpus tetragonolobus TaxID=3891 RepID=A0AAN9RZL9_PSOTE
MLEPPQRPHRGHFLLDVELRHLHSLESFLYHHDLPSGSLSIHVMCPHHTNAIVLLLVDSFTKHTLLVVHDFSIYKIPPCTTLNGYKFGGVSTVAEIAGFGI